MCLKRINCLLGLGLCASAVVARVIATITRVIAPITRLLATITRLLAMITRLLSMITRLFGYLLIIARMAISSCCVGWNGVRDLNYDFLYSFPVAMYM